MLIKAMSSPFRYASAVGKLSSPMSTSYSADVDVTAVQCSELRLPFMPEPALSPPLARLITIYNKHYFRYKLCALSLFYTFPIRPFLYL